MRTHVALCRVPTVSNAGMFDPWCLGFKLDWIWRVEKDYPANLIVYPEVGDLTGLWGRGRSYLEVVYQTTKLGLLLWSTGHLG